MQFVTDKVHLESGDPRPVVFPLLVELLVRSRLSFKYSSGAVYFAILVHFSAVSGRILVVTTITLWQDYCCFWVELRLLTRQIAARFKRGPSSPFGCCF